MKKQLRANSVVILYALAALLLFLYSYTQVDLSLTLTEASVWQNIQQKFQYLGFFLRPQSAAVFTGLVVIFFGLYAFVLRETAKGRVKKTVILRAVIVLAVILTFSYPAFSYDFFNYMFTAKTVLVYGENPYLVKPLDFAGVEPWLSFLRWTHLPSAYTPLWIGMTLFPYLFGLGYFLLIMWSMKAFITLSYLFGAYFLYRTLETVDRENSLYGTVLFALNPLVIIEGVVSPHNDMVMMALALSAFCLAVSGRKTAAHLALAFSVGVKLMTVFIYPAVIFGWSRKGALILMTVALIAGFYRKELLPWYALWVIPMAAINPRERSVHIITAGLSLGLLLTYVPVLYTGNYDQPTQTARLVLFWGILAVSLVVAIYRFRKQRIPG